MSGSALISNLLYGFESFIDLIFPALCSYCDRKTESSDDIFCIECRSKIEVLEFRNYQDNEFTRHFLGRLDLRSGASLYQYLPGGFVASIIDQIKYRGKKELAQRLGYQFGELLKNEPNFSNCDVILPVPLHDKRLNKRGYNQSVEFGKGLSKSLGIKLHENIVRRIKHTETQTSKTRQMRMENLQNVFRLEQLTLVKNKHILLVDDVLTTGATLEALARTILPCNPASINMLTLAMG